MTVLIALLPLITNRMYPLVLSYTITISILLLLIHLTIFPFILSLSLYSPLSFHHSSSFPLCPSSSTRVSEQTAAYETEQLPNATNEMAVYQEPGQDPIMWTNVPSNMYENTAFFSLHTKQFEGQGVPEPGTFV